MDLRNEMNAELQKARKWLFAVGVMLVVFNLIYIATLGAEYTIDWTYVLVLEVGIFTVFTSLAYFTKYKPRLCLVLGLVAFWGLQLYDAGFDPTNLFRGIIIKVLFTAALIKGLKAAGNAERIKHDLDKVFE